MGVVSRQSNHIVMTGGTSGIGYELLGQLCGQNKISVIGRASPRLEALRSRYPDIMVHEADLAHPDCVARAAAEIVARGEPVDILMNNAAVQHTPTFLDEDFRLETIKREIDINLTAPSILIYLMLPALMRSRKPLIVNINSGLGLVPKTSSAIYCSTKGALNILSQSLRNQFEGTKISVSQVFLPLVDTGMTKGRGTGKLSAADAAKAIIKGIEDGQADIDIGKVRFLRLLMRLSPSLARNIMKRA